MGDMSLSAYAEYKHISFQAVSASFNRHKADMTPDMWYRAGRRVMLTAAGVEYMDGIRKKVVVEVVDDGKDKEIKKLEAKIAQMERDQAKLKEDSAAVIRKKDETIQSRDEMILRLNEDIKDLYRAWNTDKDKMIEAQNQILLLSMSQPKKGFFDRVKDIFKKDDKPET